jgi:hypothetical protein
LDKHLRLARVVARRPRSRMPGVNNQQTRSFFSSITLSTFSKHQTKHLKSVKIFTFWKRSTLFTLKRFAWSH